jgi:glutaminyl-tRNA synthetase
MHMNFHLAFEKLGVAEENRETIFRYDDTNPEAESQVRSRARRSEAAFCASVRLINSFFFF